MIVGVRLPAGRNVGLDLLGLRDGLRASAGRRLGGNGADRGGVRGPVVRV